MYASQHVMSRALHVFVHGDMSAVPCMSSVYVIMVTMWSPVIT